MSIELRTGESEWEPTPMDTEPVSPEAAALQAAEMAGEPIGADDCSIGLEGRPKAQPVQAAERLLAVDALRGFALLGILAMNIVHFSWPGIVYENPLRGAGFTGTDRAVWFFNHLVFAEKMMTIFSMLFGAGLVLMADRSAARGASIRGVYYRRVLWLLVIGLIHAYLIWSGDILVLYAECGLVLYFFRNLRARTLIIVGVILLFAFVPVLLGVVAGVDRMKARAARVDTQVAAGETPRPFDRWLRDLWTNHIRNKFQPSREYETKKFDESIAIHRGGYIGIVKDRAPELFFGQIMELIFAVPFFAGGRMLLGMGLMKLGVFSATRSYRFYAIMAALGYGIGLPLVTYDALQSIDHAFSVEYAIRGGLLYNAFGSLIVALGHVGAIMLIVKSGAVAWLVRRLAAVGRMALSNYLTHSIVCTTLFYGYGFGLYGTINRTGLAAIVAAIWTVQLIISPIWLRHFRYGPAERVWRSLTYWRWAV